MRTTYGISSWQMRLLLCNNIRRMMHREFKGKADCIIGEDDLIIMSIAIPNLNFYFERPYEISDEEFSIKHNLAEDLFQKFKLSYMKAINHLFCYNELEIKERENRSDMYNYIY